MLDLEHLQQLTDAIYAAGGIPFSIIDVDGTVLLGSGWQDICVNFHRTNPESRQRCIESDQLINTMLSERHRVASGRTGDAAELGGQEGATALTQPATAQAVAALDQPAVYRCANGLCDMALPLVIEGAHVGNVYTGQFIVEGEDPGQGFFREQARRFGYPEREYLEALARVPRVSRERAEALTRFLAAMAPVLVEVGRRELRHQADLRAIQESEAWSRALLDQAVDEVYVHNLQGDIIEANGTACAALGYSREELLHMCVEDIDPDAAERGDRERLWQAGPATFESRHRRKDGSLYPVEIHLGEVSLGGQRAVLALARDMGERRAADERERAYLTSLQTVNSVTTSLLRETSPEGICRVVASAVKALIPSAYVAATHLTPDGERFATVQYLGLERLRDPLSKIIGRDPLSLEYGIVDIPPERMSVYADGKLHWLEGGVHEVSQGKLSKRVARAAEKLLGVERTYTLGFAWQGCNYGGLTLFAPPGCPVEPHAAILETLASLASLALRRSLSEQSLTASEERYRGIFENSVLGLYRSTPDGRFESVNSALARIYGFDSAEQLLEEVRDIGAQLYVKPQDRRDYCRQLQEHGALVDYEIEQVRRDGTHIWVRSNDVAVRDEQGALLCFEGSLEDVTAERAALEELRRSQERERERAQTLEVVAETVGSLVAEKDGATICRAIGEGARALLPEAIVVTSYLLPDGEHMRIVQAAGAEKHRAAARKLLGIDPFEMDFKASDIHPDERALYVSGRLERFSDGFYPLAMRKVPRAVCRALEKLLHADQVWAIGFAWGGRHFGGLTVAAPTRVDVAAHKEAIETLVHQGSIALQRAISEQSLAESEAQLRTTIDGMDAALHVVDQDLRLVLGNALFGRWLEAYGLEGDYAGKELGSVCPFLDDASLAEYRKIFVTGRPLVTEEANRVNGATIYTETHRLPIVQDGAVRQVITMIRDVSERRQADETLRESERSLARAQQVGVVGSWEWDVGGRPTDVV